MKYLITFLQLFISIAMTGQQDFNIWIPDHFVLSENYINRGFETQNGNVCLVGGNEGFILFINDDRAIIDTILTPDVVSEVVEGYETDSTYVFAAQFTEGDVLSYFRRYWWEFNKNDGSVKRAEYKGVGRIADNGLIHRGEQPDWIVDGERGNIYEVADMSFIPLMQESNFYFRSAEYINETLYICGYNHFMSFDGQSLDTLWQAERLISVFADGLGGCYILSINSLWYDADLSDGVDFEVVADVSASPENQTGYYNGGDHQRLDTVSVTTVNYEPDGVAINCVIRFYLGEAIDTCTFIRPHFQTTTCCYIGDQPISVGYQQCCGDFVTYGLYYFDKNNPDKSSNYDLAIGLEIDSSYWLLDSTYRPLGKYRHHWDYSLTVTNLGVDTIFDFILFERDRELTGPFDFREKFKIQRTILPGEQISWIGTSEASTWGYSLDEYCLVAELPNGQLDVDYSNNTACEDLPAPVGTVDEDTQGKIKIYPNPVAETIWIETDLQDLEIEILDARGTEITRKYNRNHGVDVSGLLPGIYFVRFSKRGESVEEHRVIIY